MDLISLCSLADILYCPIYEPWANYSYSTLVPCFKLCLVQLLKGVYTDFMSLTLICLLLQNLSCIIACIISCLHKFLMQMCVRIKFTMHCFLIHNLKVEKIFKMCIPIVFVIVLLILYTWIQSYCSLSLWRCSLIKIHKLSLNMKQNVRGVFVE